MCYFIYLKEKEIVTHLFPPQIAHNNGSWAKSQLGYRNSIQVCPTTGRIIGACTVISYLPGTLAGGWNRRRVRTQTQTFQYEMLVSCVLTLTAGPDASPSHLYVKMRSHDWHSWSSNDTLRSIVLGTSLFSPTFWKFLWRPRLSSAALAIFFLAFIGMLGDLH